MKRNPMTARGAELLRAELKRLKSEDRPNVIKAIAEARSHGDLSENAEYHAAREKHSFIEARIKDIEAKLSLAEVVDPTKLSGNKIAFGAHVRLSNSDTGEETTYWIVGPAEANSDAGHISVQSPLARQLLGRQVGDEVKVTTPGGTREYEVLDITFG